MKSFKKWLVRLSPFLFIVLLVAFKLLTSAYYNDRGNYDYAQSLYSQAMSSYRLAAWPFPLEAYKSSFNIGDIKYQQADYTQAEANFNKALKQAGSGNWCNIKTNIILSIIAEGDQQYNDNNYSKAYSIYSKAANEVQAYNTCFKPDNPIPSEILEKESNALNGEADKNSSTPNNQAPSSSEQQNIEQQQQKAQQQLQNNNLVNMEPSPNSANVQKPY